MYIIIAYTKNLQNISNFQIPSTTQLKRHIQIIINLLLIFYKHDSHFLTGYHSIFNKNSLLKRES